MAVQQTFRNLRQWDEARPGFPGEHWLVLGAGLLVLQQARRSDSVLGSLVAGAIGSALVTRAASGRDGAIAIVGRLVSPPTLLSRLVPSSSRRQ